MPALRPPSNAAVPLVSTSDERGRFACFAPLDEQCHLARFVCSVHPLMDTDVLPPLPPAENGCFPGLSRLLFACFAPADGHSPFLISTLAQHGCFARFASPAECHRCVHFLQPLRSTAEEHSRFRPLTQPMNTRPAASHALHRPVEPKPSVGSPASCMLCVRR